MTEGCLALLKRRSSLAITQKRWRCVVLPLPPCTITLADSELTPLTHVGEHFLEKMERATPFTLTTAISANWFKDIEKQCELEYVKASSQQEKRTEALTHKACLEHFTALDHALANLDFVDEDGRVQPECMWGRGQAAASTERPHTRPCDANSHVSSFLFSFILFLLLCFSECQACSTSDRWARCPG